jgi:hypothetical protein
VLMAELFPVRYNTHIFVAAECPSARNKVMELFRADPWRKSEWILGSPCFVFLVRDPEWHRDVPLTIESAVEAVRAGGSGSHERRIRAKTSRTWGTQKKRQDFTQGMGDVFIPSPATFIESAFPSMPTYILIFPAISNAKALAGPAPFNHAQSSHERSIGQLSRPKWMLIHCLALGKLWGRPEMASTTISGAS